MPQQNLISFRAQTNGGISDFLRDEGLSCAPSQDLLSYFSGALLDYKEEGIELIPSIVICNSIENFLNTLPGSVRHSIGSGELGAITGPKILKDCAPLSSENWYIYVERNEESNSLNYGVFTYFKTPTALPIHEAIEIYSGEFGTLIRKVSTNTIEIRGSEGNALVLLFSTLREVSETQTPIQSFSKKCAADIEDDELRCEFEKYFSLLLDRLLTSCHGTILVCGKDVEIKSIPEMEDAVHVRPNIDFFDAFSEFKSSNSAESILSLQRCEELLRGFLRCDGMIIFGGTGRVSAYRVFYKSKVNENEADKPVGGARRRAFEGLKAIVGDQVNSILFRSQDGHTIYFDGES